MQNLFTYQASQVRASIFGITIRGFVADSFITISSQSPSTSIKKAMDGSGTANIDPFGSYKVNLRLDSSSESNTLLDLIYKVYMKSGYNLRIPLIITDPNGGNVFTSLDTLFDTHPDINYSTKSQPLDWSFRCENPIVSIGGYNDDTTLYSSLQRVVDFLDTAKAVGLDLTAIEDKLAESVDAMSQKIENIL
jgi:hypothetical protein